eukprot:648962-Amphidinium_carterae.1
MEKRSLRVGPSAWCWNTVSTQLARLTRNFVAAQTTVGFSDELGCLLLNWIWFGRAGWQAKPRPARSSYALQCALVQTLPR